ncbi:MAG: hypothetical protein HZB39_01355 [Planctomycetes bacterium]|nr:hypothetical protein [Planctomycetota bacterium]
MLGAIISTLALMFVGASLLLGWILAGTDRGVTFDVERARRVVAEQGPLLSRVLALADRAPRPESDDPACQSLASELGALDIRFEARFGRSGTTIVYRRFGLPEIYEHQLRWISSETAERVRGGDLHIGEYFEYVGGGWWWVQW